jgi:RND family efflux transporter MFP subunit
MIPTLAEMIRPLLAAVRHSGRLWAAFLLGAGIGYSHVLAHEGHKPLPTRGIEVDHDAGTLVVTRSVLTMLDLKTEELASRPIIETITTNGTVVAPWTHYAVISSPLTGRIVGLHVASGERVVRGQLLAELRSPDLERLQADLRTALIERELSLKLVETTRAASASGAIPASRLLDSEAKLLQDQTALDLAVAKWRSLRLPDNTLDAIFDDPRREHPQLLSLFSPRDGIITHTDLSVGKVINPEEHLFDLVDLSEVWLEIEVLEKMMSDVRPQQRIEFFPNGRPGQAVVMEIDVVAPVLNAETHLGAAWATFSNSTQPATLVPGMSGLVKISVMRAEQALTVPLTAVIHDGAERFVLVEDSRTLRVSTYRKQEVALGTRSGDQIEVRGGELFPGDRVVTQGGHELGGLFVKGVLKLGPQAARDIGLSIEPAAVAEIASVTHIDGVLDVPPTHRANVTSQFGGTIDRLLVDRGQQVRAGQVIAELISHDFHNAQLELLSADADLELKRKTLANYKLAGTGLSDRQVLEAESRWELANIRRETAYRQLGHVGIGDEQLAELLESKRLIEFLPVHAPIDGQIVGFSQVLGSVVTPEEPILEMHDLIRGWVQGFVSERDHSLIQLGQATRCRFVTAPQEVVAGKVVRSGQILTTDERTLSVWIELDELPSFPIQHNLLARLTIETGVAERRLSVSRGAVIQEGLRAFVFVAKPDQSFERRLVVTGQADDRRIEIREGLSEGELVAVGGAAALQSGYAAVQ